MLPYSLHRSKCTKATSALEAALNPEERGVEHQPAKLVVCAMHSLLDVGAEHPQKSKEGHRNADHVDRCEDGFVFFFDGGRIRADPRLRPCFLIPLERAGRDLRRSESELTPPLTQLLHLLHRFVAPYTPGQLCPSITFHHTLHPKRYLYSYQTREALHDALSTHSLGLRPSPHWCRH